MIVKGVVDIIENDVALILSDKEGTKRHYVPANTLKKGIQEGDRVKISDDKLVKLENLLENGPLRGSTTKEFVVLDDDSNRDWAKRFDETFIKLGKVESPINEMFFTDATRGAKKKKAKGTIKIYFLNVGQGDSIFIEFPGNKNMLIDSAVNTSNSGISTYEFLKSKKISKLDVFVLTHPHIDHIEGALEILNDDTIKVKGMFYPKYPHKTDYFLETLVNITNERVEHIAHLNDNSKQFAFGGATFSIFSPTHDINKKKVARVNNSSIVLKMDLSYNKPFSIMFAGDLELDHWDNLIAKYSSKLRSNLLKISHHGSRTGTNDKLLDFVQPDEVFISVGNDNKFGHPHDEVIHLLEKANKRIYRTDLNGTIELRIGVNSYNVNCERN